MAISIAANFSYLGKEALDSRTQKQTRAEMLNMAEYDLSEGLICYVVEDDIYYKFKSTNEVDPELQKWTVFAQGEGTTDPAVAGQIKFNADDTLGFLENKIDEAVFAIEEVRVAPDDDQNLEMKKVITVKGLKGLIATIDELNRLQGLDKNIMDYLEMIGDPVNYKGMLDDDTALEAIAQGEPKPGNGDMYIVKASEKNDGEKATFIYYVPDKDPDAGEDAPEPVGEFQMLPGSGGAGSEIIDRDDPTARSIGGLEAGTVVKGKSLKEVLEAALWPFEKPVVTIAINPATKIYEKGVQTVNNLQITANVTKKTANIAAIRFYVGGAQVNEILSTADGSIEGGGSKSYTYATEIVADQTFKVEAEDAEGNKVEASTSIVFTDRCYYGFVANGTNVDEAAVLGLQHNDLKTSKGLTYNGITMNNSQIVYAYPASQGDLSNILDGNGFKYLADFPKTVLQVKGVNYNVYTLAKAVSLNGGVMVFS